MASGGVIAFAPLAYLAGALTVWHIAFWLAVPALVGIFLPLRDGRPVMWAWLPFGLLVLAVMYGILGLAMGQLFGDKFTLAALWPSTALMGGVIVGLSVIGIDPVRRPPVGVAMAFTAIGAAFFTLAVWLLPRMAGLGLIDFPKLAWGVQL